MRAPRIAVAAAVTAMTAVFAGCAPGGMDAAPPSTSPPAATATPSAAESTPTPATVESTPTSATVEPTTTAGAYVDYSDGAIEATPGPKVLFFHASWCPQCRALDEDLRARGVPDGLTVFKVDYDSRTDLRQKYGVTIQTTVVFVDDSGELISRSVLYDDPSVASLVAAMP